MLLKTFLVTARDRVRLRQIGRVMINHGLQDVLRILRLQSLFGNLRYKSDAASDTQSQRLRQALEELGPTFIKLGQILATRADLLDEQWTRELEKLHSNVTALPWPVIHHQIVASLGAEPETLFAQFNREPLAAASMAQVYRATLHSGEQVIVKVLKPGQDKVIAADLRLLAWLAEFLEQQSPQLARFHPRQLVRQLTVALEQELDLRHEAALTQQFGENFRHRETIVIPKIWQQFTSQNVIVQSFIPGVQPHSHEQLALAGFDGPTLARRGAEGFMHMVFTDRLYHGDPHSGNLMAVGDNQVAYIDFGMAGQLSLRRRNQLLLLMQALSQRDSDGLVNTLIRWHEEGVPDVTVLELAAQDFFGRIAPGEFDLGAALVTMLTIAREYRVSLPADLVLLFKALITADGVLKRIDPDFNLIKTLEPMLRREILKRYNPRAISRRVNQMTGEALEATDTLPRLLSLVTKRLQLGKFHTDIDIKNLAHLGKSIERSAAVLGIAIVIAALIIGLVPWLLAQSVTLLGIPIFPVLCFLAIAAGAIFLLWRILR